MEWIIGSFFALMLALLVYSIISTSLAIRKKAQPTVHSFFEAIYTIVRLRNPVPKGDPPDNSEGKRAEIE
jgi:hypothetical protein